MALTPALVLMRCRSPWRCSGSTAQFACEGLADHAHAADRLEDRRLHVVDVAQWQRFPQAGGEQVATAASGSENTGLAAEAAARITSKPRRSLLTRPSRSVVVVERTPVAQRLEQLLLILGRHGRIELLAARRLRQEFGDVAMVVRFDGAKALRFAAERLAAVQIGVVVDLHEGLERTPSVLQ